MSANAVCLELLRKALLKELQAEGAISPHTVFSPAFVQPARAKRRGRWRFAAHGFLPFLQLCFALFFTSKPNFAAFPYMQLDFNFATQTGLFSGIQSSHTLIP